MVKRRQLQGRFRQTGAAAIEFALLFTLFFAIFYALVSYSITMLLQQSFTYAAAEGARAAVAVDPLAFPDTATFTSNVDTRVRDTIDTSLAWLPAKARSAVTGENIHIDWAGTTMTVRVTYSGYAADPMLPALSLPLIGDVPQLPANLTGSATIAL